MPKNTIAKVYEVMERPKQLRLSGASNKDETRRDPKGRKFL